MRTHFCGELNTSFLEKEVVLCGWVNRRRDHGGVIFLDLRDKIGLAQIVSILKPRKLSSWLKVYEMNSFSKLKER